MEPGSLPGDTLGDAPGSTLLNRILASGIACATHPSVDGDVSRDSQNVVDVVPVISFVQVSVIGERHIVAKTSERRAADLSSSSCLI